MGKLIDPTGLPAQGAPSIVKPDGQPASPEQTEVEFGEAFEKMPPAQRLIYLIYNELTPDMRAILSAGIAIEIRLTQNQNGALSINAGPEVPCVVDHEKKTVFRQKDKDGQEDSAPSEIPAEQGQSPDGAGTDQPEIRAEDREGQDGEKA